MAGKGGGAWKVAYADFVTAMMAFFLVMWLVGQGSKVKEAVAEHFREPPNNLLRKANRSRIKTKGNYRAQSNNPFPSDNPNDPEYQRPRIQTIREAERTAVGTIVFFTEDSASLDENASKRLDALLPEIQGKPQKIEIRGHASRKPLPKESAFADSWQLSYARCVAAMKYLESQGVPADRIRLSQAGGNEPITTQNGPDKQSRNPRVEVFLVNEWADDLVGTREERASRFELGSE